MAKQFSNARHNIVTNNKRVSLAVSGVRVRAMSGVRVRAVSGVRVRD